MYCKKCGKEILNNADFCQNCGTPVARHKGSNNSFPNETNPNYSNGIQNPYPENTNNLNKIAVAAAVGAGVLILAGGAFIIFGRGCSCGSDDNDYSSVSIYDDTVSISPVILPKKTTSAKTASDETSSETIAETSAETIEDTIAETEQETAAETSATTESEKKSSDTELLNYLGTSFSAFTEMEGNMYDAGASSGIQYQNNYLVICGDIPSENKISFFEITGSCRYTIHGISYGMDKEKAYDILMPNVLSMSSDEPDYKYCHMNDGTTVAVHAEGGKISSISLWEASGNSGSNSNYKEAYINALNNIASSPDVTTVTFTLYDMDSSGIPELAVISGTCEADYELVFYSYADGEAKRVSEVFSGFHTSFVREKDTGQFCTKWGQMGTGGLSWYTFDGTKVEIEREVNSIDYDSDPEAFSKYGNFADCFSEMLYYSDYENRWITWTYSEDGQNEEYSGKNYDYINNY